jgi:hypothetical protein
MVKITCPACRQEMERRCAFTPVVNNEGKGFILGRADEGIFGYTPLPHRIFETMDEAQEMADYLNDELGVSREDSFEIIGSTIRRE